MSSSPADAATLHLVFVATGDALRDAFALARLGDHVVLLQDGVVAAARHGARDDATWSLRAPGVVVAALAPDLAARAIPAATLRDGIDAIDDGALVDRVVACGRSVSWW